VWLKTAKELHEGLDRLNIEIKEEGYMSKINFVIEQKPKASAYIKLN
jgi:hypothetical protein